MHKVPRSVLIVAVIILGGLAYVVIDKLFDVGERGVEVTGDSVNHVVTTAGKLAERVIETPERIAKKLSQALQVKYSSDGYTFTASQEGIQELALVQQTRVSVLKHSITWAGSTSTVIMRGVYEVKAGYDLNKPHEIVFDELTGNVIARLPKPEIFSVTAVRIPGKDNPAIFYEDKGTLIEHEPENIVQIISLVQQLAKGEAIEDGILHETERIMKKRLEELAIGTYRGSGHLPTVSIQGAQLEPSHHIAQALP